MPKTPYAIEQFLNLLHGTAISAITTWYMGFFLATGMPQNDQWTLSVNQSTGSTRLTFGGQQTGAGVITGSATAAQVQAALEGLSSIGIGNVSVTGLNGQTDAALPGDTLLITLQGNLGLAANGAITKSDTTLVSTLTQTQTGAAGTEPSTGAYARTAITFGSVTSTKSFNTGAVNFPQSTGSGYSATAMGAWGIFDAPSAGHCWYYDKFAGTDDIWTLAITGGTPSSGGFEFSDTGDSGNEINPTSLVPYNADALTVQSILEEAFGEGNVMVRESGGPLPSGSLIITFIGSLRYTMPNIGITGSTLSTGTAGLTHTQSGASGQLLVNQAGVTPVIDANTLAIIES